MRTETLTISNSKTENQDRLMVVTTGNATFAVVADGMGGLSLGAVAAETTVDAVKAFLVRSFKPTEWDMVLRGALEAADDAVRLRGLECKSKMGAAVAIAVVCENILYYTWQGNVRIYAYNAGEKMLLTRDHIADIGYGKTALTRCIKGAGLREDVDYGEYAIKDGDVVVICSDGLYNITEDKLGSESMEELKRTIGIPKDDATMIRLHL